MFTLQYKVFTDLQNPNSKYKIRKPWAENRSSENRKKQPKTKLWGLAPEPLDPCCRYNFRCKNTKTNGGGSRCIARVH